MQIRFFILFSCFFCVFNANAQQSPTDIKYSAWDIHALRYYPFSENADSIMKQAITQNAGKEADNNLYGNKRTSVDFVVNGLYLEARVYYWSVANKFIYKNFIKPYESWLKYARPIREKSPDLDLALFLSDDYKASQHSGSAAKNVFSFIGSENISYFLNEWLGNVDLRKDVNETLFFSLKSPLCEEAPKIYKYFLSSIIETEGIKTYEIAFFSKNRKAKAFEGYLYLSVNDLSFVKAVFTLNQSLNQGNVKEVVFVQTPTEKKVSLYVGNDITGGLVVSQRDIQDSSLTPSQQELPGLLAEANRTRAYRNLQKTVSLLLTNNIGIAGDNLELGPVTQMLSYNSAEGIRLRLGGNTSQKISDHWRTGGYLAYGTHDKEWKYRGDIRYSGNSGDQWQITYVKDLNTPGYDLMADRRDQIFYSLYHSETGNMSLQKIGRLSYEKKIPNGLSINPSFRYWKDQPVGTLKYITEFQGIETITNDISSAELGLSLRYAPREKHIRFHDKHIVFREPDVDLKLNHRFGMKGILGSDYSCQITDVSAFKKFFLPSNTGSFAIKLSGGKIWDRVPFPLLFIPSGNQSYVFDKEGYNLMNFYEFVTDRFVAGDANLQFNWSPFRWILPRNGIKLNLGLKTIYGPLSENNDPHLHPELFVFSNGMEAMGKQPYTESNIGLSHIFNFLRIDYVRRLTYGNKGAVFFSADFSF